MRAFLCVLDSFGVGAAPDADAQDQGADTFRHVAVAAAEGRCDSASRTGLLRIPNLARLGLVAAAQAASGRRAPVAEAPRIEGRWGYGVEQSAGKDTPSGHWEMAGLPVEFDWGYFPREHSFPPSLIEPLVARAGLPGVLGNCHASGTEIIRALGREHIESGKPIVYTSADSVLQIAAHETHFGLQRLYDLCAIARAIADDFNIGRVIARPFLGECPEAFARTANRRDLAVPPHGPTLLSRAHEAGRDVIGIGKISDIFAAAGLTQSHKAVDNKAAGDQVLKMLKQASDGALVFANFNDFDTLYGHRRDVAGYAAAIEAFDAALPAFRAAMRAGDLMVISADHGCDPTWPGSDHTRELAPILAFGPEVTPGSIGRRESFADIGQSIAGHLGLDPLPHGRAFDLGGAA